MAQPAKYYSVKSLSQRWDVSTTHIYNMIESGSLQAIKIGASIRIKPEAVEAYEEGATICQEKPESSENTISRNETMESGTYAGQNQVVSLKAAQQARNVRSQQNRHSPTL